MEFNNPLWQIFLKQELDSLKDIFNLHPQIASNFLRYLNIPPENREAFALEELYTMQRAGWLIKGIPFPETVRQHSDNVALHAFLEAPDGVDKLQARTMAEVHDLPEAIITDLTPLQKLGHNEKTMMETLALKVIYQHDHLKHQEVFQLFTELNEQKTITSQWVNDADKLDALFVALQYEVLYPEKTGLFNEFSVYASPRIKTPKGMHILSMLMAHTNLARTAYASTHLTYGLRSGWLPLTIFPV